MSSVATSTACPACRTRPGDAAARLPVGVDEASLGPLDALVAAGRRACSRSGLPRSRAPSSRITGRT